MITKYEIEGMKCEGCPKIVAEKFESLPAVSKATVDLDSKIATVESSKVISIAELNDSLSDTKFKVSQEV